MVAVCKVLAMDAAILQLCLSIVKRGKTHLPTIVIDRAGQARWWQTPLDFEYPAITGGR